MVLQDSSCLQTPSEMPAVVIDTELTSESLQIDESPSLISGSKEQHEALKNKIESEMDPSDISNVSAARLVRQFTRILNKLQRYALGFSFSFAQYLMLAYYRICQKVHRAPKKIIFFIFPSTFNSRIDYSKTSELG